MNADRPGQAFQAFVAKLERVISQSPGVTFETCKRLVDKDTGRLREHDVVITRRDAHHTIVTAIECKDTGRKVGVPVIEAFSKKCEKTGINHQIIVSANGFTASARVKAAALDIMCMELRDAESFDWMEGSAILHIGRTIEHILAEVFFDGADASMPFTVFSGDGTEMTPQHFDAMTKEALQIDGPRTPARGLHHILINTPGWYAIGACGERYPIKQIGLEIALEVTRTDKRFDLHTYVGDDCTYQVASTPLTVGEHEGHLMMIEDGDGTRVVWSPTSKPN